MTGPPRIDLHTHSTASDGTLSPAALVRAGQEAGLSVQAITDHDTTGGWAEAAAARPPGLTLVRGAELSCRYVRDGAAPVRLHLLAYLFDPAEPVFAAERRRIRDGRLTRGRAMVDKLQAGGFRVSWEEVLAQAAGGTVGRPHVARAMIARGYVADVDEAFGPEWIGSGGRFWAPSARTDVIAAIGLVRAAGGVPVFAHPRAHVRGPVVDDAAIREMAGAGLGGLEVDHLDHPPAARAELRALAAELGLLTTGSSDFHGDSRPIFALGACVTDPAVLDAIVGAADGCAVLGG